MIEITKICNKSSLINIFHIEIWNLTLKSPTKSSDFIGFLKIISSRISKFSVQHVYSNQHIYWILGNFPSNTFIPTNSFIRDSRVGSFQNFTSVLLRLFDWTFIVVTFNYNYNLYIKYIFTGKEDKDKLCVEAWAVKYVAKFGPNLAELGQIFHGWL